MNTVRIGIAGLGNMGSVHARQILAGGIPGLELAAVWDTAPKRLTQFPDVPTFPGSGELVRSGAIDAIIIATPHYSHTTIGVDALQQGLHVLVEKPISAHKADCERLIAARKHEGQVFAAMFNQRTDPHYIKIRELVQSGELGEIRRINWIMTNWYRSEAYYASSKWRATWAGEGGGVLLNQAPHNLDLLQWIFGMPSTVRGFCRLGHYHDIEVEDDVTAYLEYPNGASAVFITTTGEAPGTNRLEITGELGKLVYENDSLVLTRNDVGATEFSRTTSECFGAPVTTQEEIPVAGHGGQHNEILKNFAEAILEGAPLIARGEEGIKSVELANSILFSSLRNETIPLPLDSAAYKRTLDSLVANSTVKKKTANIPVQDFAKSFR